MQFEKLWEFSDAQAMPSGTSVIADNICDWTAEGASALVPWLNAALDLWLCAFVNTVPTGTSLTVKVYQYTSTTITSGTLLMTGYTVPIAQMSANPKSRYHLLFAVPFNSCFCGIADANINRYFGLVYTAVGNCSDGKIDAFLRIGKPEIPTTQKVTSNI